MSGIAASRVKQPYDDQRATDGFGHSDERSHDFRIGNADLGEAAGAENVREDQLLNSFMEENHQPDLQPDQDGPARRLGTGEVLPSHRHRGVN